MRFHSCMCSCCYTAANSNRVFTSTFDSPHTEPFDVKWEKELSRLSMFELRDRLYKFVTERAPLYGVPLCINPHSAAYKSFARYVSFCLCDLFCRWNWVDAYDLSDVRCVRRPV